MNTLSHKMWRLSRAKSLIGILAGAAALAGVAQAAVPASALALKAANPCQVLVDTGHAWEAQGNQVVADFFYDRYWDCIGGQ